MVRNRPPSRHQGNLGVPGIMGANLKDEELRYSGEGACFRGALAGGNDPPSARRGSEMQVMDFLTAAAVRTAAADARPDTTLRLNGLDHDALVCILAKINESSSVLSVLCTCRALVIQEDSLWRSLCHKFWPQIDRLEQAQEPWKRTYCRRVAIGTDLCRHLDTTAACIADLAFGRSEDATQSCELSAGDVALCRMLARHLFAIAVHPVYSRMAIATDALTWAKRVGSLL